MASDHLLQERKSQKRSLSSVSVLPIAVVRVFDIHAVSSAFTEHFHALSDKLEKALVDRLDLVNRPSQRPPAGAIEGYDDDKMSLVSLLSTREFGP